MTQIDLPKVILGLATQTDLLKPRLGLVTQIDLPKVILGLATQTDSLKSKIELAIRIDLLKLKLGLVTLIDSLRPIWKASRSSKQIETKKQVEKPLPSIQQRMLTAIGTRKLI